MMGEQSIDIVIPVHNEEQILEHNVMRLRQFLEQHCSIPWTITIASNGSTDRTEEIGRALSTCDKRIRFLSTPKKGKAQAYRLAWPTSTASIVGFMDADLATGLEALLQCLAAITSGSADIAIGNRFARTSIVKRSFTRELLSHGYHTLIRLCFPFTRIQDAHCGFKFLRADIARVLLPRIKNNRWFFDTELLMLAEHAGYRIAQLPVHWADRKESRVRIGRVISEYVLNLIQLRFRLFFLKQRY